MRFEPLGIPGAARILPKPHLDDRGAFVRIFCHDEFAGAGLSTAIAQSNLSFNERRGTLRGLHFQWPPSGEAKTVRCTRGAILDVLLDLRPDSPAYLTHLALRLDDTAREAVFIPAGVAHGFQTLEDRTEVLYLMSDSYAPELAGTVRWDDPRFGIDWPIAAPILSERDAGCPPFDSAAHEAAVRERASRSASWSLRTR